MPWRPARHRGSPHQRGLGQHWRTIRNLAVLLEPWCHNSRCARTDAGTPANPLTGEHRIPRRDGGTASPTNVTVLCRSCNSAQLSGAPLSPPTVDELARLGT